LQAPFPVDVDAQSVQASLSRAGIDVQLIPLTYTSYISFIQNSENALDGKWDLAFLWPSPTWFGENNGRDLISSNFEGKGESNFGRYNNDEVNGLIHHALEAGSTQDAESAWSQAAARVMDDAAIVPLIEAKFASAHSARVRHCVLDVT